MADISGLVQYMAEQAAFTQLVNDPLAPFGTRGRNYLGAEILPERMVPSNEFTEEAIQYRTVLANDATRFSPVQLKGSTLTGSMRVSLGNQDIGSQFTGQDYDALIRLLEVSGGTAGVMGGNVNRPSMTAEGQMLQWADRTLNRPLLEKIEQQRWQAIDNASVIRTGDNNYREVVNYPNPSGHRVAAGGTWSDNAYDPYLDIIARVDFLKAKGFTVNRIVTTNDVRSILALNAKMIQRAGKVVVSPTTGGVINQPAGRATIDDINTIFGSDALPPLELYDLQYRTQTGSGYFKARGTMTFLCTTGRDETIDRGDLEPLVMQDVLGYAAIGRPTGQPGPGRVVKTRVIDDSKPPRIEGEAWQTSLPVITEPEAIAVITGIA